MQITIIAVGKIKEKYLTDGISEYLKRLRPYASVSVIEVADEKAPESLSPAERQNILAKEAAGILKNIDSTMFLVALAIEGKMLSSEEFAAFFAEKALAGKSRIAFIIGGSLGLGEEILKRADMKLSFSHFTFPHQLMRLILLEQIYRAFKIIKGEPYHK